MFSNEREQEKVMDSGGRIWKELGKGKRMRRRKRKRVLAAMGREVVVILAFF